MDVLPGLRPRAIRKPKFTGTTNTPSFVHRANANYPAIGR